MHYSCLICRDWKQLRQNTMKTYIWEMNNSFYVSISFPNIFVRISFSKCCLNTFSTTHQTSNCEKRFYSCFMYKIRYFGWYSNFITIPELNKNNFHIIFLLSNIKCCIVYFKLLSLHKLWLLCNAILIVIKIFYFYKIWFSIKSIW